MEKETKKWWLLATGQTERIMVTDDYYNHNRLFETSKPFWGTKSELVQHIQEHWFTKEEIDLLKKGWKAYQQLALVFTNKFSDLEEIRNANLNWRWRGTFKEQQEPDGVEWRYVLKGYNKNDRQIDYLTPEELQNAPRLNHEVLFDVTNAKLYLSFDERHEKNFENDPWDKTLYVTCLDENGTINSSFASEVVAEIKRFVTDLQSTI